MPGLISLDTECTGIDFHHGAMPFLVTTCDEGGDTVYWEWPVDPLTRRPQVPDGDAEAVQATVDDADVVALHNAKFDQHALATIGVVVPWHKVRDTFFAGHLLASNHPHNLTDMCVEYLGCFEAFRDIAPLEAEVERVTKAARTVAKRDYPEWRLARDGEPDMPSVSGSSGRDEDRPWKADMWLPRALAQQWAAEGRPLEDAAWLTACADYANGDSAATVALWLYCEAEIGRRGLGRIYAERLRLLRPYHEMEDRGVTMSVASTDAKVEEYGRYVVDAEAKLVGIAADMGYSLELAEGASINDNMRGFFYGSVRQSCPRCKYAKVVKHWGGEHADGEAVCPKCAGRKRAPARHRLATERNPCLGLPVVRSKKSGGACLDKDAMQDYQTTLDAGQALDFISVLASKRGRDTSLQYLHSYRRFWVPSGQDGFRRLHPNVNPCGTDHLRAASYNPNGQNISKKEAECQECEGDGCADCGGTGVAMSSMRHCFGPATGRVWYSMDLQSIERRIPPYECRNLYGEGDAKMLDVFERPDDPPYWGSLYLLTASVLYPDEYWPLAGDKVGFKKRHPRLYKQSKFFDLAKQYGCGRKKGDALSRVRGSFDLVDSEFPMLAKLQSHYLQMAHRLGYVETIPDRKVDPDRGYPILASRTDDGRVLTTTPFNYHVSGTACWVKNAALVECQDRIVVWRAEDGWDGFISLEIHDEILFDMPLDGTEDRRARELKGLIEGCGDRIGMPTPCTAERHDRSWAEGAAL